MNENAIPKKTDTQSMSKHAKGSILVVDDNTNNLKLVRTLLADKAYKVRVATSGEMALKSATTNPPDLILLDINMPGVDGYETCEKLKKDESTKSIPVIFLSAVKESFDMVRGFGIGGVDFVTKPFKPEVLMARIDTHLSLNKLQLKLQKFNDELERKVQERTLDLSEANLTLQLEVEKRVQAQNELLASEELHRLTLANLEDTIVITTDNDGKPTYISPNVEKIIGYKEEEIYQLQCISKLLGDNHDKKRFEKEILTKDNKIKTLFVSVKKALIRKEVTIYTCQDVTDRKRAERELAFSEARLKYALAASNEGIWDWDMVKDKAYRNQACYSMLGFEPCNFTDAANEINWVKMLHPDDRQIFVDVRNKCLSNEISQFDVEYRCQNKNGDYIWLRTKGMLVERDENTEPTRMVGTTTDITQQKEYQENLRQLATYDSLTGLPNRKLFIDMLQAAIARGKRKSSRHSVLFLDLDRFKNVNDSLGHSTGDKLLEQVAQRISDILREDDIVARLGGDEFTILLQDIPESHRAAEIASRVIDVLNEPFNLQGQEVSIAPSIGIVFYPDHATNSEDLLKKADTAMYHAKQEGGQNYKFFSHAMDREAKLRLELEGELRQSINRNEFILFYQPKVDLQEGVIVGMEALVRWNNQNKGIVAPNHFIPIAEETGLIVPIGNIVLHQAATHTKGWFNKKLFNNKVAVNISARQFKQEDLLFQIDRILDETRLAPEYLELELTEAAVIQNMDMTINIMSKIKDRGITLALDDFGTGYSSLSYLKKFPIDTLKIDMSFIRDMQQSEANKNIVNSIIELAHSLKLKVVAEGVETLEQAHVLAAMECDIMQGYLFSKPLDNQDFESLLKNGKNLYTH